MAVDLNIVVLVGRVTRDLELKYTQSGMAVCNIPIACNRSMGSEQGDKDVSFFDVVVFGKSAEIAKQYLTKGQRIGVEGHLQQRRWEDQNGQKRSKVDVVANRFQFLDSKNEQYQQSGGSFQKSGTSTFNANAPKKNEASDSSYYPDVVPPPDISDGFDGFNENDNIPF